MSVRSCIGILVLASTFTRRKTDVDRPRMPRSNQLGFIVALTLAACSPPPKQAFEDVAGHVNPALLRIRPAAATLSSLGHPDVIIPACTSVDEDLRQLSSMHVHYDYADVLDADSYRSMWGLAYRAEYLLTSREAFCLERPLQTCSDWCTSNWWRLLDHAKDLRRHASEELVDIVALR